VTRLLLRLPLFGSRALIRICSTRCAPDKALQRPHYAIARALGCPQYRPGSGSHYGSVSTRSAPAPTRSEELTRRAKAMRWRSGGQCVVGSSFARSCAANSRSTRSIFSVVVSFAVVLSTICNTACCGVLKPA
jgi:hypothetical protein